MIIEKNPHLFVLLRYVGRPLAVFFTYDLLVTLLYVFGGAAWIDLPSLPLPLLGSAIVVFVAFRNNTAYARWWEARTLWGNIANLARVLARQTFSLLGSGAAQTRATLIHGQIAYVHTLRLSLRRQDPWSEIDSLVDPMMAERLRGMPGLPGAILAEMARELRQAAEQGLLDSVRLAAFDATLGQLAQAQGGLERIKATPLPRQYAYFPHLFVQAFCLLLPLGLVGALGLFTPLGSTLIGFAFLALDRIGTDLEDPFEGSIHDVPMTAITRGIEIELRALLGETNLPPPLAPVRGVLW